MPDHEKLNYLEFPARDLLATKTFFTEVFGWQFTDYGPEYTAFDNQGLEGGFYLSNLASDASNGAALPVFYTNNLEATLQKIVSSGGNISTETFEFPGGRRFHFKEPSGNEFAVWSE
jgi:predicted enzyme related to lactoylglutathione lyase